MVPLVPHPLVCALCLSFRISNQLTLTPKTFILSDTRCHDAPNVNTLNVPKRSPVLNIRSMKKMKWLHSFLTFALLLDDHRIRSTLSLFLSTALSCLQHQPSTLLYVQCRLSYTYIFVCCRLPASQRGRTHTGNTSGGSINERTSWPGMMMPASQQSLQDTASLRRRDYESAVQ